MATSKTTIELNGKLYDARTGKIISEVSAVPRPTASTGHVVDGFVRRPQAPVRPNVARTEPKHVSPQLQKSKTLMRPAVQKPQPVVVPAQTVPTTAEKHEVMKKVDPTRAARAVTVERSAHINRFNPIQNRHEVVKKEAQLEVIAPAESLSTKVHHIAESAEHQARHSVDIIEESLRNATSHLNTFEEKAVKGHFLERVGLKNKFANIGALSLATVLLAGFFAYQNVTSIEMRVAAARTGVSATMPSYNPAGFTASKDVKTGPGKVSLTYKSNSSDKQFTVSQQASNWSSDSLLSNHVAASKAPYQTYQSEGKTVYIFDNSNATWVSGGVWYKVDGNANLTSDQLLRIASSM